MSRPLTFTLYFVAIFFQSGAYGLTFLLPKLFSQFGANEKAVGAMLMITAVSTITTVYFSGHLSDYFGRVRTLALACLMIAAALFLYAQASSVGAGLVIASLLLGAGWGLTYSLGPIVLTRLVTETERVRYFTLLSVFVMAGFGLSPVLASIVEDTGRSVADAFAITSVLCLVSSALFFGLIKAIRLHALVSGPEAASRLTRQNVSQIIRSKALLPVSMVCIGASVFAGLNNFQTVFAENRGLDYATYYLVYTLTVIAFRIVLVRFKGGNNPYQTIAWLQYIMASSVLLFLFMGESAELYVVVAFLFGIGYGVSYPLLVAVAANDAEESLVAQTLQLFALMYFIGIFGFPLVAGWIIVDFGPDLLLWLVTGLAVVEATMALRRSVLQ